jgi:M6 family metalloprotease-like protein
MRENSRMLQEVHATHGFVLVLVLLVQFPDHIDRNLPPVEEYEELFNGMEPSDIIPTGSIAKWLDDNSYGAFRIEAEVMDWVVTDMTEEEYSFNVSGVTLEFGRSMYPALDHLENLGFNLSRFDLNGDGVIDSIVLLHSGYAAEIGGVDCVSGAEVTTRIWSHGISNPGEGWESKTTGMRTNSYSVSSGLFGQCGADVARLSVITHEFLHTLGLPDLNGGNDESQGRGTGDFDIMSNAHGRDGEQLLPACLSPWSKIELGWVEPEEIISDGIFEIEASETAANIYVIRRNFPTGESLIIENRQPLLWDELLWNGGLLIWHLDDNQDLVQQEGYPGQPGWPGNGRHYGLAVVSADGKYDLEMGNNSGDNGDYWRSGAMLGPGPVEVEASDSGIYPNTNSYQSGTIQQTGIVVDQISDSSIHMSFRVRGVAPPDTANPTELATENTTSEPFVPPTSLAPVMVTLATDLPTSSPSDRPVMLPTRIPLQTPEPSNLFSRSPTVFTTELVFLPSHHPSPAASILAGPIETFHWTSLQPFPSKVPTYGPIAINSPALAPVPFSPNAIPSSGRQNSNIFDRPNTSVGVVMLQPHRSLEPTMLKGVSGAYQVAASVYTAFVILWSASFGW